jgi:hypothetical protein
MMRWFTLLALTLTTMVIGNGQGLRSFMLSEEHALPFSNVNNDLVRSGDTLWAGTSSGLAMSLDHGLKWKYFDKSLGFRDGGISAIAVNGRSIWIAQALSYRKSGEAIPIGVGLSYSSDGGLTWQHFEQPMEERGATVDTIRYGHNNIRSLAITARENNLTYDIAINGPTVWVASFAGMLRRSDDRGTTWSRVVLPPDNRNSIAPTDTLDFDLSPSSGALGLRENLNHRVFSVIAASDGSLWVGTAAGINVSTDGGTSWRRLSHQNQLKPISGNFVVALSEQRWNDKTVIWAATVNALDPDEQRGVSFSNDGGETWTTALLGEFAHNFAFKDSIAYVATDNGLFRTDDMGRTWLLSGSIIDPTNRQRITATAVNAVAVMGDTVWVATGGGLAYTIDSPELPFGSQWRVLRRYESVVSTSSTYSYPSPFSPDDQAVRIHYALRGSAANVSIRIFDFSMQLVKTLIQNAPRSGAFEHDEVWDGRDEQRRRVANGVYFYRIDIDGEDPRMGKIFVVE